MKPTYGLGVSTFAIAMSMATAAQANEGAPQVDTDIDAIIIADHINDVQPIISAGANRHEGLLNVTVQAPLVPADISRVASLAAPVSIEEDAQDAIYAVDFISDAGEGLVTLNTIQANEIAPVDNELPQLGAPFEINADTQQAIYDVDFLTDGQMGTLSLPMPDLADMSGPLVTPRGIQSHSLDARYGDIDAFYGDIVAFYGDIDAFWGDINPFYGDIGAFYGDINAFYGDIDAFWGNINPFYGDISAFWGDIDAFWGDIDAFQNGSVSAIGNFWADQSEQIDIVNHYWDSNSYWYTNYFLTNRVIKKAVEQFSSKGFTWAKAHEVLARHGIKYNDQTTLNLTPAQRAAFFLDWHDTINTYTGIDAVDHWMTAINWTPKVTQIQGSGSKTIIGIIDGNFSSDADLGNNIIWSGGGTSAVGGHGAGVASLIAGAHDGFGVMGIAPDVKLATYNPFDTNGNGSWTNVADGFVALKTQVPSWLGEVSIVNLSLGEKGHVFSNGTAQFLYRWDVDNHYNDTLFVFAAGNEGVAQNWNVEFNDADETAMIFVGSVNPAGEISSFSNRPGSGCLTDFGRCFESNKLYMRTVVAPGELLLVSDGQGGVTRASGTSFAAPLVSGAVALLHERWPWLAQNPHETAEIIFRSARDLGAPGPDEVYGWGLLDVAASQSPLDFNALQIFYFDKWDCRAGCQAPISEVVSWGLPTWWDSGDVRFSAYEWIGDTWRDFSIPMSVGTRDGSNWDLGRYTRAQDFISDRFARWVLSGGSDKDGDGRAGVTQMSSNIAETSGQWTMRYDAMAPRFTQDGAVRPVHNAATLTTPDGKASFTLGHGQGAMALAGGEFGIMSDHDAETGGVNPVLGFASGEVFAGASYKIAPSTKVSVGFSAEREDWEDLDAVNEMERQLQKQLGAREAEALTVSIDQNVTDRLSVGVQFTHLDEADAVLGIQLGSDALLGEGSRTDAVTVSANFQAGSGLSLDLSLTGGATDLNNGQILATSDRAISTAGQFAVNKRGVMNSHDVLRVAVGQPLSVESGTLEFTSQQVVDRQTGQLGAVTQSIGIETKRRFTSEFVYATPVTDDAEFGLIGRYVSAGEIGQDESFMIGANFGLRF